MRDYFNTKTKLFFDNNLTISDIENFEIAYNLVKAWLVKLITSFSIISEAEDRINLIKVGKEFEFDYNQFTSCLKDYVDNEMGKNFNNIHIEDNRKFIIVQRTSDSA